MMQNKLQKAIKSGLRFPYPEPPKSGEVIEIASGVLWAQLPLPMALDHVNIYFLKDGEDWVIIDSGIGTQECEEALQKIIDGPLQGRAPKRMIATHYHPDHIGLCGWLSQTYQTELWCSRTSFLYARMLQLEQRESLPKPLEIFFHRCGFDETRMKYARNNAKKGFHKTCRPLPMSFQRLKHGDSLQIGERNWRVWQGDGHAPEHLCFYCEKDRLLLAGDQLLPRITSVIPTFITELYENPLSEWLESCRALKSFIDPETLVLCGHNEPFYGADIRLEQLLEHHQSALDRLESFLKTPNTVVGCYETLFRRTIGESLQGFANAETLSHLNYLESNKNIHRYLNKSKIWIFECNSGSQMHKNECL